MTTSRRPREGKAPRTVRQARVMSHRARRQLASSPDEAVARVEAEVGRAFEAWASRFVELVVKDIVRFQFPNNERADSIKSALRQDATVRQLFEEAGRATPRREVLESAFRMVDKQSADEMRVAGVRTADVVPGLPAKQASWIRQNTDLIRAESDLRRRVERVIADPINEGRSVADISKKLQEQAGYSKSRAELTARDQTLKVYGQIQEERQRAAGITKYIWSTSLDERVRPDHAELDGTVQAWDAPPIVDKRTGRRANPGLDYQCRCTAVPVLDDDVETGGEPPPPEPAMQPTQAELDLTRRQAEAEARRAQLEADADRRIAAARAEAERIARAQAEADRLAREAAQRQASEVRAAAEARLLAARTPVQVIEQFKAAAPKAERVKGLAAKEVRANVKRATEAYASVDDAGRAALKRFTGGGYRVARAMQSGLTVEQAAAQVGVSVDRAQQIAAESGALAAAQRAMTMQRPTAVGALYRGLGLTDARLAEWLSKDTVEFTVASNSTTFSPKVAQNFATAAAEADSLHPVVLRIVDVDEAAMTMHKGSLFKREQEMIVGTKTFRIVGRSFDASTGTYRIDLTQATSPQLDALDPRGPALVDFSKFASNGAEYVLR